MIDLNEYAVAAVDNAPTVPGQHEYWNTFTDGAQIAPGDVYVICHESASAAAIESKCNQTMSYELFSSGDDGLCLAQGTEVNPTYIDCVGDFNGDPGSGWEVAGVNDATKDHTLVRKSGQCGESDWSVSAGTDSEDSQWWVYEQDDFSDIGEHSI